MLIMKYYQVEQKTYTGEWEVLSRNYEDTFESYLKALSVAHWYSDPELFDDGKVLPIRILTLEPDRYGELYVVEREDYED